MVRSMIGIKRSDKVRNTYISKKTKVQDATLNMKIIKWKWSRLMIRGKDKSSKLVTQRCPREEQRKRRRQ